MKIEQASSFPVIPFKMWDRISNFGDAINPYIIKCVSGLEPVKVRSGPHLLAIGSVLQKADAASYAWGTGIMHPSMQIGISDETRICAVRGKKTWEVLQRAGLLSRDIPLGDPGFFVRRYLRKFVDVSQPSRFRICVIPHHASQDSPAFQAFERSAEVKLVSMRSISLRTLQDIYESDVVLSQSLHGLVFAEAFGKANLWISEKSDDDWCFKFRDWYSNTRAPADAPALFRRGERLNLEELSRQARLHDVAIDEDALSQAFPMDCATPRPAKGFVPFEAARARAPVCVASSALTSLAGQPLSTLDEKLRRRAEREIKMTFRSHYADWAETQYTVIGDDKYFFDDYAYQAAITVMDKHSNLKFAFLAKRRDFTGDPRSIRRYQGVDYVLSDETVRSTMVVRPNEEFSFLKFDPFLILI